VSVEPDGQDPATGRLTADAVRGMFDRIAPVYDAMNRIMTAGLDRRWRRLTAGATVRPGDRVLDACCGTGGLSVACARAGGRVTGVDFSERMLERARRKAPQLEWVRGDALALPFAEGSFDAATVGFGVRNLEDLPAGLRELRRVLRAGGRIGVLEITRPRGLLAPFYRVRFDGVVPLLGRALPGGAAYTYLPASVRRFPGPEDLARELRDAGFGDVRCRLFAGGVVALHTAVAAPEPPADDPAATSLAAAPPTNHSSRREEWA
jgi:demethylmenaquinone methyltransferase / 2-methoxy-6-polyprenyl-1,4-benzoquinol methylase